MSQQLVLSVLPFWITLQFKSLCAVAPHWTALFSNHSLPVQCKGRGGKRGLGICLSYPNASSSSWKSNALLVSASAIHFSVKFSWVILLLMFDFTSEFNFLVPYQSPSLFLNGQCPLPVTLHKLGAITRHAVTCSSGLHSPAWAVTCSLSLCLLLSWVLSSWFSVDALHIASQGNSPSLFQQDLWFGWFGVFTLGRTVRVCWYQC